eukprot:CAMPEP_0170407856 /NCGR_PEP_ID=MMETSP0117_2-20130122/28476_1 /TAXON_ID=400756 /ORGANISM="Durinskia baltica, Strain CSIRO CS-38" /LENGTH=64 /DNA_ID=CAMNT_0010665143 /DNA_START=60 /DNA_END=251 /DNA_ORIENTATION=-
MKNGPTFAFCQKCFSSKKAEKEKPFTVFVTPATDSFNAFAWPLSSPRGVAFEKRRCNASRSAMA